MIRIIPLLLLTFFALNPLLKVRAQIADSLLGQVRVVRDYKLDLLQERFNKNDKVKGYRVQIHSGLRKEEARKIKSSFILAFPEIKCYESYQQPYFNIKAGDFLTKLDAQCFLNNLRKEFPNSFIVPEIIQPKSLLIKKKDVD